MQKRVVLDRSTTPDGETLELAIEHGHHILRVGSVPLMSSAMRGSEEAMAEVAAEELGEIEAPRILIGGLGMGFTLRATLDAFGDDAEVTVAELMPVVVRYNRSHLADLAERPLEDPRVTLFEGDVKKKIDDGGWDAILLDVDNGPDALTSERNERLYGVRGTERIMRALAPGGVVVVWSSFPSPSYVERLRRAGLEARARSVRARWPLRKGPMHTLFVGVRADV